MSRELGLIQRLIDSQSTFFMANGRSRKCYTRLVHDALNHPVYGYEIKAYAVLNRLYCIYEDNLDLKEKDEIKYSTDRYIINSRIVLANKKILLLVIDSISGGQT